MLKTTLRWTVIILLLLALAGIPVATAGLSPMGFGFPTMSQFTQNTAFNNGFVNAFDFETADIQPFGSAAFGFPSVGQSAVEGQSIGQVEFAHNTVISAYSFPAVDTGLGFAGFGDFNALGSLGHLF